MSGKVCESALFTKGFGSAQRNVISGRGYHHWYVFIVLRESCRRPPAEHPPAHRLPVVTVVGVVATRSPRPPKYPAHRSGTHARPQRCHTLCVVDPKVLMRRPGAGCVRREAHPSSCGSGTPRGVVTARRGVQPRRKRMCGASVGKEQRLRVTDSTCTSGRARLDAAPE